MTRERLQSISLGELAELARSEGLEIGENPDKAALIDFLLENQEERKRERTAENNAEIRVEEAKYEITDTEEIEGGATAEEALAEAARSNCTKLVLMVRDPHWAFAYWQIEQKRMLKILPDSPPLLLRVHETTAAASAGKSAETFDIPVQVSDSSWYICLPNDNSEYWLELGYLAGNRFHNLAASNRVRTPRESVADPAPGERSEAGEQILAMLSGLDVLRSPSSGQSIPQRIMGSSKD
jgi:hypothetical protein